MGESKVGDLAEVRIHKFKFSGQTFLLAYKAHTNESSDEFLAIDFYQIGSHENLYDKLKKYIKIACQTRSST
jgi:hypothetical protein